MFFNYHLHTNPILFEKTQGTRTASGSVTHVLCGRHLGGYLRPCVTKVVQLVYIIPRRGDPPLGCDLYDDGVRCFADPLAVGVTAFSIPNPTCLYHTVIDCVEVIRKLMNFIITIRRSMRGNQEKTSNISVHVTSHIIET